MEPQLGVIKPRECHVRQLERGHLSGGHHYLESVLGHSPSFLPMTLKSLSSYWDATVLLSGDAVTRKLWSRTDHGADSRLFTMHTPAPSPGLRTQFSLLKGINSPTQRA